MAEIVNFSEARLKTEVKATDIMAMSDYGKVRKQKRADLVPVKKTRRVPIGPHATFYFESYDTMWLQIHEMLFIEKGGAEQIPDELAAYNPLIPKGRDLSATLMFEIDDEKLRKSVLGRLGGVEETIFLKFGDHEIVARAEEDVDRTTADGKASSVQFIHFDFTDAQAAEFKAFEGDVMLGIRHENYPHMTMLPKETKAALAGDLV
ncbi:DUF3501 family protein [Hyphobacterium sp. HN65]|uniref:DUF3501 family protein n=1 Tax=Hyphobacterium lacteum TaxID=3116575 RepID=A0ABU7LP25_9PROT|nr:DUF3501 family protein [Hyphobacterium sp. HN65]MEE2525666.1 DUF3501 family protein [Hyphobacterium sp. HN65]